MTVVDFDQHDPIAPLKGGCPDVITFDFLS